MQPPPSFVERLALGWRNFFRILGDPAWALAVSDLNRSPQLPDAEVVRAAPASPPERDHSSALLLLSILQRNGRFLDFVQQDIAPFSDAEVGQVARVVHAGCRKVMSEHLTLGPVRLEQEGQPVTLRDASEARKVKLSGKVEGVPPYHGVLKHRGWETERLELPEVMAGQDSRVLALAEVEL